jgi:flavin reductase (DIM6/NTAB) family NADH-FMN oxidoreductase RutF
MDFDMAALSPADRYKLVVNTVTPRPIAWTVTQGLDGVRNCAPHSFFNALSDDPVLVVLGLLGAGKDGGDKDTARLIRETGEFTVGLVSEDDAEKMVLTAVNAPPGVDELELAGIATRPSLRVRPPIIASAPVSFECKVYQIIDPSPRSCIVLGEVLTMHIDDRFVSDPAKLRIDTQGMKLIGRQHGAGNYVRNADNFEIKRVAWPLD